VSLATGQAGEHLVCADLILKGYRAFLADQGAPFDVVVVTDQGLRRVQVRTTKGLQNYTNSAHGGVYRFQLKTGKKSRHRFRPDQVDIVAFVTLDTKTVAYLQIGQLAKPDGSILSMIEFRSCNAPAERKYKGGKVKTFTVRRISDYGAI
jgi:hypothetical protein